MQFFPVFYLTLVLVLLPCTSGRAQRLLREEAHTLKYEQQLLYLHTDRTLYTNFETVHFKAYLNNGFGDDRHSLTDVVSVQLVDSRGAVMVREHVGYAENGYAGQITLNGELTGGKYTIRAYTNWLGNFGESTFFTKEIYLQTVEQADLLVKVEPKKQSYQAGEDATYKVHLRNNTGYNLPDLEFRAYLRIKGSKQAVDTFRTDQHGLAEIGIRIPEETKTRDLTLSVEVTHRGAAEIVTRLVPLVLEDVHLAFFPEGGHRAAGSQRIAFQGSNDLGKPVDVTGGIYENGRQILNFNSRHNGYGSFLLPAGSASELEARVSLGGGKDTVFKVPEINQLAISAALNITKSIVTLNADFKEPFLWAELRMTDSTLIYEKVTTSSTRFDLSNRPPGVYRLRLYDAENRPRWERLFFHRPQRVVRIDSVAYQLATDGWDTLSFQLRDEVGKPVRGDFSLAVVDDALFTKINDKQPGITAKLLLQSQIRGKLFEPNDYFDPDQPEAMAALDDLLLCHGWRATDWLLTRRPEYGHLQRGLYGRVEINRGEIFTYNKRPLHIFGEQIKLHPDSLYHLRVRNPLLAGIAPAPGNNWLEEPTTEAEWYQRLVVLPTDKIFTPGANTATKPKAGKVPGHFNDKASWTNTTESKLIPGLTGRVAGLEIVPDAQLDEVVVVGYGSAKRSNTTAGTTYIRYGARSGLMYTTQTYIDGPASPTIYFRQRPNEYVVVQKNYYYQPYPKSFTDRYPRWKGEPKAVPPTLLWRARLPMEGGGVVLPYRDVSRTATYRVILEGITEAGTPVHAEKTFSRKGIVDFEVKFPTTAVVGDSIMLSGIFRNNTDEPLRLFETLNTNGALKLMPISNELELPPGGVKQLLRLFVPNSPGRLPVKWSVTTKSSTEVFEESATIEVRNPLFEHIVSASGRADREQEIEFEVNEFTGKVAGKLTLAGSPKRILQNELKYMLRRPSGCFEQTLSATLPNAYAVKIWQQAGQGEQAAYREAVKNVNTGYQKMLRYEVKDGGFSLYGQRPANPGLTALGLLAFAEMDGLVGLPQKAPVGRAARWLSDQIDTFEVGPNQVLSITALLRHGINDYAGLLDRHVAAASVNEGLYRCLIAEAYLAAGDSLRARALVESLVDPIRNRLVESASQRLSFSHRWGELQKIEILGYYIPLYLDLIGYDDNVAAAITWIAELKGQRNYMSSRASAQYLRAMAASCGNFEDIRNLEYRVELNGQRLATGRYYSNWGKEIEKDITPLLQAGTNRLKIVFSEAEHYPFLSWKAEYKRIVPANPASPPLTLSTQIIADNPVPGELIRWNLNLRNERQESVYAPMLQVGLPGNAEILLKDLDPLVERGVIGRYELAGPYLNLYFTEFEAGETRAIPLDFQVLLPGSYAGPPTVLYPYYEPDQRYWIATPRFTVYPR